MNRIKSLPDMYDELRRHGFGTGHHRTFHDSRLKVGLVNAGDHVKYQVYVMVPHKEGHDIAEFLKGQFLGFDNVDVSHTGRVLMNVKLNEHFGTEWFFGT